MKYIVLLRGVNVSGKNKIKMAELKEDLNAIFSSISTYIQSGNLIVTHNTMSKTEIEIAIQSYLLEKLGNVIPVFVFELSEFVNIVEQHPFENHEKRNYFCFYKGEISNIEAIKSNLNEEKIVVKPNCIHIQYPDSYSKSKIDNNFIEKKLGLTATMRNWNTVNKLVDLANS